MGNLASTDVVFDANVDACYQVITDYRAYPEFVEGTKSAKVISSNEQGAKVEFTLQVIKEFKYTIELKHFYQPQQSAQITWELVSGDLFQKNSGKWILTQQSGHQTRAHYELDLDFKIFVPKMILSKLVGTNLPVLMENYHQRIKSKVRS